MSKSGREIKRPLMTAALVVLCVVFAISGAITAYQAIRYARESNDFDELKKQLGPSSSLSEPEKEPTSEPENSDAPEAAAPEEQEEQEEPKPVRISTNGRYDELYAQNPEMYGWITVEGTKIDYPVMYTPDDPEKYLHLSFEGKKTLSGVPFIDALCFEGCNNYIIYGHHMNNGKMFAGLLKYADEDFYKEHKTVIFDTIEEHGEYEIIAAFRSKVYRYMEDGVFYWYNYTDLRDEDVFNEYIAGIDSVKLYDTGVTAEFGDELITLSTCASNSSNRFVVVAKRIV